MPTRPDQRRWRLGDLRELAKDYPQQKVREIHCDEWGRWPAEAWPAGAGASSSCGFYYLENVYKVRPRLPRQLGPGRRLAGRDCHQGESAPSGVPGVSVVWADEGRDAPCAAAGMGRRWACRASKRDAVREVLLGCYQQDAAEGDAGEFKNVALPSFHDGGLDASQHDPRRDHDGRADPDR